MNAPIKKHAAAFLEAVLRELILERRSKYPKVTRRDLAAFLEIDPASAMRLENGETDLSVERFAQICFFLKQDPVQILHKASVRVQKIKAKTPPEPE